MIVLANLFYIIGNNNKQDETNEVVEDKQEEQLSELDKQFLGKNNKLLDSQFGSKA